MKNFFYKIIGKKKKILSLLLVFLIIFNIIVPSMAATNMNEVSVSKSSGSTEDIFVPYHSYYTLLPNGKLKRFLDKNRIISEKIQVENNKIYYFKNLSAKYGNCFYVIYDSNNEVLSYLKATEGSTGEILENTKIIMPENASYFRLACDLTVNDEMFTYQKAIIKWDEVSTDYDIASTLLPNGKVKDNFSNLENLSEDEQNSEKKRNVSYEIYVTPNSTYKLTNLSAKYGNCFYVIYDSDNNVISYQGTSVSSTGETLEEIIITMPENASYFRMACDLNVNNKMFKAATEPTERKTAEPAVISFTDDDCKIAVYDVLFPLIQELDLPYTLACPPNRLNYENVENHDYITPGQLKELYDYGIDIVSHHLNENAMTEFKSIEDYENDTIACLNKFNDMEIEVNAVSYPNGRVNEDYIPVVKEYFKLGLTVDRGINTLPYESYYIDRCEVFPKSGIYNIDDAKALVDSVAENGGWLVFMTHCWFETFSKEELKELVLYIRSKNIEISNISDVIEKYSNTIEIGTIKKPLTDMAEDYFVIDCMGKEYTNNPAMTNIEAKDATITEKSPFKWHELSIDYNIACTLLSNGKEDNSFIKLEGLSDTEREEQIIERKRNVSEKFEIKPNTTYKLENLSAKSNPSAVYTNCLYVIYDSNNKVIGLHEISDSLSEETFSGEVIMPANAHYLKIACDLNVNNKMFKIYEQIPIE